MVLMEVKSTHDSSATVPSVDLEKTSDSKVIKNNKRSAAHQLRDHLEILYGILGEKSPKVIQRYIAWPFLGQHTRDPQDNTIRRWKEDGNLHIFENTISEQDSFERWFFENVLQGESMKEDHFTTLLNRFIILSCGVFVDEIDEGIMALLTQEQLQIMNNDVRCQPDTKAFVVHGVAGTGKTLLVLRKLQQLYQTGRLNDQNRALYVCYWPGIRCDLEMKLETLGIRQYVDTARFFISIEDFLKDRQKAYKHIFMDEAEALCLAFDRAIVQSTLLAIYRRYHDGNCNVDDCPTSQSGSFEEIVASFPRHQTEWGELWFLVDINQASMFLPKHSPQMVKTPAIVLSKVMRSSESIFNMFKQFYSMPMPSLPKEILDLMQIPNITIGHHIEGPPIYWTNSEKGVDEVTASVVIDLCATKGIKPNDLCVIPFLVNEKLTPGSINKFIDYSFGSKGFRPQAISDVEQYLLSRKPNDFLIPWALRVKGLEFKVVIMAIDDDDYDCRDGEDRKKAYTIASRCTSMLILVSTDSMKHDIDLDNSFRDYPFCLKMEFDERTP